MGEGAGCESHRLAYWGARSPLASAGRKDRCGEEGRGVRVVTQCGVRRGRGEEEDRASEEWEWGREGAREGGLSSVRLLPPLHKGLGGWVLGGRALSQIHAGLGLGLGWGGGRGGTRRERRPGSRCGGLTLRASLWYLTAFLVSATARSTKPTDWSMLLSMRSIMAP